MNGRYTCPAPPIHSLLDFYRHHKWYLEYWLIWLISLSLICSRLRSVVETGTISFLFYWITLFSTHFPVDWAWWLNYWHSDILLQWLGRSSAMFPGLALCALRYIPGTKVLHPTVFSSMATSHSQQQQQHTIVLFSRICTSISQFFYGVDTLRGTPWYLLMALIYILLYDWWGCAPNMRLFILTLCLFFGKLSIWLLE